MKLTLQIQQAEQNTPFTFDIAVQAGNWLVTHEQQKTMPVTLMPQFQTSTVTGYLAVTQQRCFELLIAQLKDGSYHVHALGKSWRMQSSRGQSGLANSQALPTDGLLRAFMPGKIIETMVKPGDAVTAKQTVAIIEAMKMENEIHAPMDGVVEEIYVRTGDSVEAQAKILKIKKG